MNNPTIFNIIEANDPLEIYMKPFNSEKKLEKNISIEPINELTIKEKLQKINNSIQSITLSPKGKESLLLITNNILETISSKTEQSHLFLIDNFFNVFIDLICYIKDESICKENLLEKLNTFIRSTEDLERKCSKLKKELQSKQRELDLQMNKAQIDKEKITINKKSFNNEINDLKTDNKKLLSQINLYKNEIRKKDIDYQKVQEKLKTVLIKGTPISSCKNSPDIISNLYVKENSEIYNECADILRNSMNQGNQQKMQLLTEINGELISLLKIIHSYLIKLSNNADTKGIKGHQDVNTHIMPIKDDVFTLYLTNPQVMKQFSIAFLNNLTHVDDLMNYCIKKLLLGIQQRQIMKKVESARTHLLMQNKAEDAFTSIKEEKNKNDPKKNTSYEKVNAKNIKDNNNKEKDQDKALQHNQSQPKWFDNCVNKNVIYTFNEADVLKCTTESEFAKNILDNNNK